MHSEAARESIDNFSLNEEEYFQAKEAENVTVAGTGSVFMRDVVVHAKVRINFGASEGCKVFLGRNVKGNIAVGFKGHNSLLFVGDDCVLNNLQIRSFQAEDFIAIGNGVTTTSKNVWISGHAAGKAKPAIIVGDDCMFSYDIVIRNSDAHPIFSLATDEQVNEPKGIVHIEPHVWVGERVSILKAVRVGACSILSLGSIVTKDIPRFSIASGVPAIAKVNPDIFWARNSNERLKKRAKYFVDRYKIP